MATDALGFILNKSTAAMTALSEFLGGDGEKLLIASASTQEFLEESGAFPDMALRDSNGNLSAFIESKFWAPLTHNQPVTYWKALPTDRRTVLLFLVPQARFDDGLLWDELVVRLRDKGHELSAPTRSENVISASASAKNDQRRLMLISWEHLLGLMAERIKQDGDIQAEFEVAELKELARVATEGSSRDDPNAEYKWLFKDVVGRLVESGWGNTDGLAAGGGFGHVSRYFRLAGAGVGIFKIDVVVKQTPDKPLLLAFFNWVDNPLSPVSIEGVRARLGDEIVEPLPELRDWLPTCVPIALPVGTGFTG